jgi:hypothetical protein
LLTINLTSLFTKGEVEEKDSSGLLAWVLFDENFSKMYKDGFARQSDSINETLIKRHLA